MEKVIRILVVDDEKNIVELMRKILSDYGYDVKTALSGQEAIEKLKKEEFDLVITDVIMPKIDGLELLEIINEIQPSAGTIIMTGHSSTDTITGAFDRKASGFLLKPFKSVKQVINKIERVLVLKGLRH